MKKKSLILCLFIFLFFQCRQSSDAGAFSKTSCENNYVMSKELHCLMLDIIEKDSLSSTRFGYMVIFSNDTFQIVYIVRSLFFSENHDGFCTIFNHYIVFYKNQDAADFSSELINWNLVKKSGLTGCSYEKHDECAIVAYSEEYLRFSYKENKLSFIDKGWVVDLDYKKDEVIPNVIKLIQDRLKVPLPPNN